MGCCLKCCHGHCRSSVAAHRLQQDCARFHIDLAHLLRHDEAVILVADQQGISKRFNSRQALLGLLQEGVVTVASERPILLWIASPRKRPKTCASAAAEDRGNKRGSYQSTTSNRKKFRVDVEKVTRGFGITWRSSLGSCSKVVQLMTCSESPSSYLQIG